MEKHTVAELKDMCRSRGLKVSGNKRELIDRLAAGEGAPSGAAPGEGAAQEPPAKRARAGGGGSGRLTAKNIGSKLEAVGIPAFSRCASSAICKGFLRWNGMQEELDQPAVRANGSLLQVSGKEYSDCEHTWNPTLRSLLEQTDYPGTDYEDGMESATVQCPQEGCEGRLYVTAMCMGQFREDSGKFHNHCTDCKGLGKCIGDYREAHCSTCGKHYFAGVAGGFGCPRCDSDEDEGGFGFY